MIIKLQLLGRIASAEEIILATQQKAAEDELKRKAIALAQEKAAQEVAKKQHLAEAVHVAEHVNSFATKLKMASEKKNAAAALVQQQSDLRAIEKLELINVNHD